MIGPRREERRDGRPASALVLNIGTLYPRWWRPCCWRDAAPTSWASRYCWTRWGPAYLLLDRDGKRILAEVRVAVVRGNAGEVSVLAGKRAEVRGVQSISAEKNVRETARDLAARRNA